MRTVSQEGAADATVPERLQVDEGLREPDPDGTTVTLEQYKQGLRPWNTSDLLKSQAYNEAARQSAQAG